MSTRVTLVLERNLRSALNRGQLDQAAALLENLKREAPLAIETRECELEYLTRAGQMPEAGALARQLTELYPASARIQYLAGVLAYKQKEYAGAERLLNESLKLRDNWQTRHWLGKALTQAGKLAEARPILEQLVAEHPECRTSLAWLYERLGDTARALTAAEKCLAERPGDRFVAAQVKRLRAHMLPPDELQQDVEALVEHGEEIPAELFPEYVETLLKSGQSGRARDVIYGRFDKIDHKLAMRIGWTCYKLQAYDIALRLFTKAFPAHREDFKMLAALERSADRCGAIESLIRLYSEHVKEDRRFFGRIRALKDRMSR